MMRPTPVSLRSILPLALLMALGNGCVSAQAAEEQWDLARLDLEVELCPYHNNLFGHGTAKLRLVRGPSHGPTLVLSDVSRFTKCTADIGDASEVRVTAQRAEVRFPQLFHTGEEVDVSFEFKSGGDSCPVVVTPKSAYARCHGDWYPHPLEGSVVAPGTTRLNVPEGWRTLANGTLADSQVAEGRRIDTWKSEVPTARSFVAGPYSVRRFSGKGSTVVTYFLGEDAAEATTYGEGMRQVLSVLEARIGSYPYEACTLVEIPDNVAAWKGAAENGLVFVGSSELHSEGFNTALIAHEVAHQWWGNFVGSRNPAAQMVDEALAQYGIVLVIEALEGEQAATEFLRFSRDGYLPCECARAYFDRIRGQEHDKPLMELTGEGRDYWLANAKGHWVYHMLRQRVGDALFFRTLRNLIARHGGGEMSLADLRAAFVTAAPPEAELKKFFDQWLDRPGAPILTVTWTAEDGTDGPAARVTIQQQGEPYDLRLEVAVDSGAASRMHLVALSEQEQTFLLPAAAAATDVRIDPHHRLLIWNADYEGAPGR